jgi:hypothetical protein
MGISYTDIMNMPTYLASALISTNNVDSTEEDHIKYKVRRNKGS